MRSGEFYNFYQEHFSPLCRHLQALGLRDPEDLNDVLQNTFLEAHDSFAQLRDPQAALAWLLTIGRRQFARYVARRVRQRRIFVERNEAQERQVRDAVDLRVRPGDEQVIASLLSAQVMRQLDQIEDATRQLALRLFFLEDLALKDIAARTATKVSTLTTWISRFRDQAQERLAQSGDAIKPLAKRRGR